MTSPEYSKNLMQSQETYSGGQSLINLEKFCSQLISNHKEAVVAIAQSQDTYSSNQFQQDSEKDSDSWGIRVKATISATSGTVDFQIIKQGDRDTFLRLWCNALIWKIPAKGTHEVWDALKDIDEYYSSMNEAYIPQSKVVSGKGKVISKYTRPVSYLTE